MGQTIPNLTLTKPQTAPATQDEPLPDEAQDHESSQRLQTQADQRVELGMQLLHAAQAHTTRQQAMFNQLKSQQQRLREEMQNDIARSLQTYDQWMAKFDQTFTAKLTKLESRIDAIQTKWTATEHRIATILRRFEGLLNQHQCSLQSAAEPSQDRTDENTPTCHDTTPVADNQPQTSQAAPKQAAEGDAADLIYSKALQQLRDDRPRSSADAH